MTDKHALARRIALAFLPFTSDPSINGLALSDKEARQASIDRSAIKMKYEHLCSPPRAHSFLDALYLSRVEWLAKVLPEQKHRRDNDLSR